VEFVRGAQQSLDVAMYLLSDRRVIDALEASRRRGVQVRVMLEENPYGSGPGNRAIFDRLRAATIATRWSPSSFQLSHDKYAVADRKVALIGTANWTHSAFTENREFLVEDSNPRDVDELETLFNADWEHRPFSVDDDHLVVSPENSRTDLLALIGSARQTVHVEAEEVQDTQIESALIDAASRGVEVDVLIPGSTGGNEANAAGAERLTAGHVHVRRLHNPYVHAKVIVVDGHEAFIGSENISAPSLDRNREVGLLVSDAAAIRRVEDTFSRDWRVGQP
jgi:cardiolipin synthase